MAKPIKMVANSAESLSRVISAVKRSWAEKRYVKVVIRTGRDRSLDQNALLHAWILQISEERGEESAADIKAFCKLRFFVPILRGEDEEFLYAYDLAIKPLEMPVKLQAIRLMPVTSRCSVDQLSRGLEAMQAYYTALDTDPVFLEFLES